MPRSATPTHAFPLTETDKAFLARIEYLVHAITDRIMLFVDQRTPVKFSPTQETIPAHGCAAYAREFNACARTLLHLQKLWHMIKALAHQHTPAQPEPLNTSAATPADPNKLNVASPRDPSAAASTA